MTRRVSAFLLANLLSLGMLSGTARAADDDGLGDIIKSGASGSSERAPGAPPTVTTAPDDTARDDRVIKTLQKKNFMKIGRFEAAPHIGFVTNDPFIQRYLVGSTLAYHITEIFALEGGFTYSPDFGDRDRKPVTDQLIGKNRVSPDISKVLYLANINFQFSPIYGKIAVADRRIINFDIFGSFGTGIVRTDDDLEATGDESSPDALATEFEYHPTTNIGGGFRIVFSKSVAARLEGRSLSYIEVINSTNLEMKNYFTLLASFSIFFPGME